MLIALVFTVGNLGNHFSTYFIMPSDAANISSFAAALDHPDYFVNDAVLNNSANFAHYDSIQVPLTRFLGQVFGSYGSAFGFLIFPVTFLHLIGYYILGIALLKKRTWALLLTLCLMVPVAMNLGENWGLVSDVIPRFLFQALLPFLLTAVIHWGHNPKSWLWLMIATGLLVYVHPVSLPVLVYRVYLDGHEQLVRGLRLRGLNARSLKDIEAASNEPAAFDYYDNGRPFAAVLRRNR